MWGPDGDVRGPRLGEFVPLVDAFGAELEVEGAEEREDMVNTERH